MNFSSVTNLFVVMEILKLPSLICEVLFIVGGTNSKYATATFE